METVLKFFNGKIEGIFILTSRYEGSYLGGMMHRINEAFWFVVDLDFMHTYANNSLYRYGSMLIEREEMTPGNVLTVRNKYIAFIYIRFLCSIDFLCSLDWNVYHTAPNFFQVKVT